MTATEETNGSARVAAPAEAALAGAYLPIEDYGAIGDGRSAALVSRYGSIDWLCWPRFDSPAVLSRLLDSEKGGTLWVRPAGQYRAERSYKPESNVLTTRLITNDAAVEITDAMVAPPAPIRRRYLSPESLLIRKIEGLRGHMELEALFRPVNDYFEPVRLADKGGSGLVCTLPGQRVLHLSGDARFRVLGDHARAALSVGEGKTVVIALAYSEKAPAVFPPLNDIDALLTVTDEYWRSWVSRCSYDGPYREVVTRSALTLTLLQFAPSGALVAAPTTSLPEKIGGVYNWDYRYCWLRDSSLTVRALFGLGFRNEAAAFVQWLLHATRLTRPRLQVMYAVYGRHPGTSAVLSTPTGTEGSRPVRIGNLAGAQKQLDVYGHVMQAVAQCVQEDVELDRDQRAFLEDIAKYVAEHWEEPDSGIWETRRGDFHHTHSKAMCWVALDRAAHLAERGVLSLDATSLRSTAEKIASLVHLRGFSPQLSAYTKTLGGNDLDAALLQLPLMGFVNADDPRMAATIETIRHRLGHADLLFRHTGEETAGEGAFAVCSFWLVDCLARQGRLDEARSLFERLLRRANDVGLYAEEIDPETGGFLGNFPLAFTHVGLVNAALTLHKSDEG